MSTPVQSEATISTGDRKECNLLARLSARLREAFLASVPRNQPVALIDYPDSMNCGDHAIWLGEKALLKQIDLIPVYQCTAQNYHRDTMAAQLGNGTILLHGGGNFGDRYRLYHEFRLRVLCEFPNNKIVIGPQQVTFLNNTNLRRTAEALAAHPDVTLLSRGVVAHHLMQQYFGGTSKILLAPDMAFALGPQTPIGEPHYDVVWISRTDREKASGNAMDDLLGFAKTEEEVLTLPPFDDKITLVLSSKRVGRAVLLTDWYGLGATAQETLITLRNLDYDKKSKIYFDRARFLLSLGHVVITDRLHGHILCLMLGKPHIFLNNDSGKNWNFYDTWTRESPLCRVACNPKEALDLARAAMPKLRALSPVDARNWSWF
jgi:exopolysaccharide biosynthesis predicted pyruvyltransferase EpsI